MIFKRLMKKWRAAARAYDRFMEKQGFHIVLFFCILTIAATAVYTHKNSPSAERPTYDSLSAAAEDDTVQRLKDAETPSPAPIQIAYPLEETGEVRRAFDGARPAYFENSRHWQLHPAMDIAVEYGQKMLAVADGSVAQINTGGADGLTVVLEHAGGYQSCYKGLSDLQGLKTGDAVKRGQPIAGAGYGPLLESGEGAHLHLEIRKNSILINPADLFE